MAEIYREFGHDVSPNSDFSDTAIIELYNHESYGTILGADNGFAIGKRYLNLQVTSWKEALLEGSISKSELYEDEKYPTWWLDSVLKNLYKDQTYTSMLSISRASGTSKIR